MSQHSDQVLNDLPARYFLVLGAAAADLWSELPQDLQHRLFERAVVLGHQGEQDESLREQLAKFLHDHHERTLHERSWRAAWRQCVSLSERPLPPHNYG